MTHPESGDLAAPFISATRISYDTIAQDYADSFADHLAVHPVERSLLAAFAELVRERGTAPVADLGSGPGHVAARLHAMGVPVFGVDVSPRMVELARAAHPALRFHVGSMTSLDLPDATLGGVLALYSIIHVPDDHLPRVFAEFHRVLAPGGQVMLGFQWHEEEDGMHLAERFGHAISLDYHWRTPDAVADLLVKAGFRLRARLLREPGAEERLPRAFLLAHKPEGA
ncbi:class I SAM-dependent methyltransferase [Streptomyces sp. NPDC002265]|uniref:class I SAM-dependent methyltransferase n=1 Tax=Streptomyces sp. NPDC002265 TaxID=3154415 RepID=UPI00332B5AF7